jgi:hypothetical protein
VRTSQRNEARPRLACAAVGLTALAGVCYFAPTLRRCRDLSRGSQAFAKPQASVGRRSFPTLRLCCWVLALSASACGPVGYLQQVHGKARDAVSAAKRAGAESAAPYEYTSAVEYLKKAEEEGDHAEYQVAIEYGRQAQTFAERARGMATKTTTTTTTETTAHQDTAPSTEDAAAGTPKGSP